MCFLKPLCLCVSAFLALSRPASAADTVDIDRAELLDRIYGGWLGQMIGNLQGLPHEFKYKDAPRAELPDYVCGLPKGGWTDDDTDIEWVHIDAIDKGAPLKIPYPQVRQLWLANMHAGIWVSNLNVRGLMQRGLIPPATSSPAFNRDSWYNLSGQFCVESYGLIAPGMPQTAADIGLHYARISVWAEPLQATQYWTSLIAMSYFHRGTLEELLTKSLAAIDPNSAQAKAIQDAIAYFHQHPNDWKAARQLIHKKWLQGTDWNWNATPPNAALVVLALLYGQDDIYKSLQYAFALGYDADCNAAIVGAVLGVRQGYKKLSQTKTFVVEDIYLNNTRDAMPKKVKISEQAEQLLRVAEKVIVGNGGEKIENNGKIVYRIKTQAPKMLEELPRAVRPKIGDPTIRAQILKDAIDGLKANEAEQRLRSALVLVYYGESKTVETHRAAVIEIFRENKELKDRSGRAATLGGMAILGDADALTGLAQYVKDFKFNWVTIPDVIEIVRKLPPDQRARVRDMVKAGQFEPLREPLAKLFAEWDKDKTKSKQ